MLPRTYNGQVKVADNTVLETLGLLHVPLNIVYRIITVPLIILEDLTYECILGMHFLETNRVIIDNEEHDIHFKTGALNLQRS